MPAETRYDVVKLECRGLLCALKKFRYYLDGVQFLVEIDARMLVHQLNQPTSDIPGAIMGRLYRNDQVTSRKDFTGPDLTSCFWLRGADCRFC